MPNFRALARALTAVAAMTIFTSLPVAHAAEKYPNRPIRMILGFPAGGPTDVNARLFAQGMADQLGQPIIVENRPGAGSIIASNAVLAAAPDGYTILYNTSSLVLAAMLYTSAKYDPLKDFQPVIRTAGVPLVVAVNPSIGATTFGAFIDQARAKPKNSTTPHRGPAPSTTSPAHCWPPSWTSIWSMFRTRAPPPPWWTWSPAPRRCSSRRRTRSCPSSTTNDCCRWRSRHCNARR